MLIDNLNNLNRSTRTTIFGALIITAAIAMYNWVISPHVTHLFAAQEYEAIVSKAEEKNEAVALKVEANAKELEKLCKGLDKARSSLSTAEEAKKFFSDLQDVAEEAGCTVNSLNLIVKESSSGKKYTKSSHASGIVANSAMLTVSGQYHDIMRLVEKLQNYNKRIWLDSFNIKTVASDADLLKCAMTITIYTIEEGSAE